MKQKQHGNKNRYHAGTRCYTGDMEENIKVKRGVLPYDEAPNSEYHRGLSDEIFDTEDEAIKALEDHKSGRVVFKAVKVHVGSSFFICSRKNEIKKG